MGLKYIYDRQLSVYRLTTSLFMSYVWFWNHSLKVGSMAQCIRYIAYQALNCTKSVIFQRISLLAHKIFLRTSIKCFIDSPQYFLHHTFDFGTIRQKVGSMA